MKEIKGYEGLYSITEDGKVWGHKRKNYLSPSGNRYQHVVLCKNGLTKTFSVHRLVAETYIPNPQNLPEVNHKDQNIRNNHVDNLEWCDRTYNNNYGTRIQKISKPVRCVELDKEFDGATAAAEEMGLHATSITACCRGRLGTTGGYHWEYL